LVIDLKTRQGNKAEEMICEYKKLTPWQRYEALIYFSESDEPPCTDVEFEQWAVKFHRDRLNPEDANSVCDSQVPENK
jgi:hypothetical protein